MPPGWALLATLDCLTPDILANYFGVQFGGSSYQWGVRNNNCVFVSHLCAPLHRGMPLPLSGPSLRHFPYGPQVVLAGAGEQIKGLASLLLLCCGLFRPGICAVALKGLVLKY